MKYFIIRNSTIESFFTNIEASYSGYDDISYTKSEADTFIWFYILPFKQDIKLLVEEISSYFNNLMLVYKQIPADKNFYIFSLSRLYRNNIQTGDFSLFKAISEFNFNIIKLASGNENIKIIDIDDFYSRYPIKQLVDWKYYYISQMLINPKLANDFQIWFQNQVNAIHLKRKKCIVLDLDNTLWGGILGEDGFNCLKIGGDYPGNAFLEFQKSLIELTKSGIILTICSKNNETDVLEAWDKNPFIALRKEYISAYRINWNNKADNIKELAEELNIGLDSFVFIDDNPAERELVKKFLPMVEVPDFPSRPYGFPVFIKELTEKYFRVYTITEEDENKTQQYKANTERSNFQKNFSDFSDYLKSLEIVIQLQKANAFNIPRIAQMTQKTNQFNLTTKRYIDAEISKFVEKNDWTYCISVKDKFGDNGITGLIIIEQNISNHSAKIDSLLLSCRILGKGIEEAFVFSILNILKSEGIKTLFATYLPTQKNVQVENFYEKIGFELIEKDNPIKGAKYYKMDITKNNFKINPYYKIEEV